MDRMEFIKQFYAVRNFIEIIAVDIDKDISVESMEKMIERETFMSDFFKTSFRYKAKPILGYVFAAMYVEIWNLGIDYSLTVQLTSLFAFLGFIMYIFHRNDKDHIKEMNLKIKFLKWQKNELSSIIFMEGTDRVP